MEPEKLKEILAQHQLWLDTNGEHGEAAHLQGADLSYSKLKGANLAGAKMQGAYLTGADFTHVLYNKEDLSGVLVLPALPLFPVQEKAT